MNSKEPSSCVGKQTKEIARKLQFRPIDTWLNSHIQTQASRVWTSAQPPSSCVTRGSLFSHSNSVMSFLNGRKAFVGVTGEVQRLQACGELGAMRDTWWELSVC